MQQQQQRASKQFTSQVSEEQIKRQAHLLKSLGDRYRLQIINLLQSHRGVMTVADIVAFFDSIAQPTVSHHLRILKDAGLIDCRKEGLHAYYYVQHAVLTEAYSALYRERTPKSA